MTVLVNECFFPFCCCAISSTSLAAQIPVIKSSYKQRNGRKVHCLLLKELERIPIQSQPGQI